MTSEARSPQKVTPPSLIGGEHDAPGTPSLTGSTHTLTRLLRGRTIFACFVSLSSLAIGAMLNQPLTQPITLNTIFAGSAGFLLGLSIVMCAALLDNRIRWPQDAQLDNAESPLLGAVPMILNHTHSRRTHLAALCVHEIRALLQIRAEISGAKAIAITSPNRRAGKTSLTLGLASSLALSGRRTLIVDCDLSQRMGTGNAQIGVAPLLRNCHNGSEVSGYINCARQSHSLEEVLLATGCIDRQATSLSEESGLGDLGLPGLFNGVPLARCAVDTNIPDLLLLPARGAHTQDIGRMSNVFVRHLIEEAETEYDIILFDTGPIPGSVEALFVTSAADAVVLVVPRGESPNCLERSIMHLQMVGAHLTGTVFNRASPKSLHLAVSRQAHRRHRHTSNTSPLVNLKRKLLRSPHTKGAGVLLAAVQWQSDTASGQIRRSKNRMQKSPNRVEPVITNTQWASAKSADVAKELLDDAARHQPSHLGEAESSSQISITVPKQAGRQLAPTSPANTDVRPVMTDEAIDNLDAEILDLLDDVSASSTVGSKLI